MMFGGGAPTAGRSTKGPSDVPFNLVELLLSKIRTIGLFNKLHRNQRLPDGNQNHVLGRSTELFWFGSGGVGDGKVRQRRPSPSQPRSRIIDKRRLQVLQSLVRAPTPTSQGDSQALVRSLND